MMWHNYASIKFWTARSQDPVLGVKMKVSRCMLGCTASGCNGGRPCARLVYKFDVLPYKYLCDHSGKTPRVINGCRWVDWYKNCRGRWQREYLIWVVVSLTGWGLPRRLHKGVKGRRMLLCRVELCDRDECIKADFNDLYKDRCSLLSKQARGTQRFYVRRVGILDNPSFQILCPLVLESK